MKQLITPAVLLLLILSSCATPPRVKSSVLLNYPAQPSVESVIIYDDPVQIPSDSEVIGLVSVTDDGNTRVNLCDSVSVMNLLREEARKAGANAMVVTEHIPPGAEETSLCHQMTANLYYVYDFQSESYDEIEGDVEVLKEADIQIANNDPFQDLPRFNLGIAAGYGWRTNELSPYLTDEGRAIAKKLMNGVSYSGHLEYFIQPTWGLGLNCSLFTSNYSLNGISLIDDKILYIGPSWVTRMPINERMTFHASLGLGYISYTNAYSGAGKIYGSNFGAQIQAGLSCNLSKNIALTMDLHYVSGSLDSMTAVDSYGYQETLDMGDTLEGLSHLLLQIGLRYQFY